MQRSGGLLADAPERARDEDPLGREPLEGSSIAGGSAISRKRRRDRLAATRHEAENSGALGHRAAPYPLPRIVRVERRMLDGKTVAVVVPAYNEEALVASTLATIPVRRPRLRCGRRLSRQRRNEAATGDPRVDVLVHERNRGVGAAIVTGYQAAMGEGIDVTAVMAADGQMDPDELETFVGVVGRGECDYAKANRLFTHGARDVFPRHRYLGNAILSFLTKIASGYWHRRSGGRPRRSTSRRCSCSTSTGCTRATGSRTTSSCT